MLSTLIIITIAVLIALTAGSIILWKKAGKKSAATLAKVRLLTVVVRLLVAAGVFAIGVNLLVKEDVDTVMEFTIVYSVAYFLLQIFDTLYFNICLRKVDKENIINKETTKNEIS